MTTTDLLTPPPAPAPPRPPAHRYPLETVLRLTRAESCAQLAEWLGVKADTVRQWSRRGLSSSQADWVATRLGYVPQNIWGEYCDDVVMESDEDPAHVSTLVVHALVLNEHAELARPSADRARRRLFSIAWRRSSRPSPS